MTISVSMKRCEMTNVFYILIEGGEVVLFLYLKGGEKKKTFVIRGGGYKKVILKK